jgi:bifunctional non-homologous end joining protein LigD
VSTPLRWEELRQPIDPDAFTISTIFKRLDRIGDLFAPMLKDRQDIGPFCEALHG